MNQNFSIPKPNMSLNNKNLIESWTKGEGSYSMDREYAIGNSGGRREKRRVISVRRKSLRESEASEDRRTRET